MLYCPDCHSRVIEGECMCDILRPHPPQVCTISWVFGSDPSAPADLVREVVNEGPVDHMTCRAVFQV